MTTLVGHDVFTCGDRAYSWNDVLVSAWLRGEWDALEAEVRQGLACWRFAEETDCFPSTESLNRAAEEFRYARSLLTAEETEAWFARWELTIDGWYDCLQRRLLREALQPQLSDIIENYAVERNDVDAAILYEGVCSDYLTRWATELAARASAAEASRAGVTGTRDEHASNPMPVASSDDGSARVVSALFEASADQIELLRRLDANYERFCGRLTTPAAIEGAIARHRLDWIRLRGQRAVFPDEQMAREAILCVRDDGGAFLDVAASAGVEAGDATIHVGDAEETWRPVLLAAQGGDLIGPLSAGDAFTVFMVENKIIPSADDPDIRRRAERGVIHHAIEREVQQYVKWHIDF
jgi:hypothetical protein